MTAQALMTFASSASQTLAIPASGVVGIPLALPAVDGANLAARVTNPGAVAVWINPGIGGFLPCGPTVNGSLAVPPNSAVLVQTAAGAATGIGAVASNGSVASLIFERGSLATTTFYDVGSVAVPV